jgi:hypothetical protein
MALFFPVLCFARVLLVTERIPLSRDRNFAFTNSTGVFLPSIPFPLGARQRVNGQDLSIEELHSLRIDNTTTELHFPDTAHLDLAYWRIPPLLCPSSSYVLHADFHITSRSSLLPPSDLCFFVDPRGAGHVITIVTQSAEPVRIQFYVNNSIMPYYECEGLRPNQRLRCSSPFDQPFFARITGAPARALSLQIEYSVTYRSEAANGCRLAPIPAVTVTEDAPDLHSQNQCVSLVQETLHLVLKCAALATVLFMIAVFFQRLGYWNFCEWMKMPGDVPIVKAGIGSVAVETSITATRMAVFDVGSFLSDGYSESSELSAPIEKRSIFA